MRPGNLNILPLNHTLAPTHRHTNQGELADNKLNVCRNINTIRHPNLSFRLLSLSQIWVHVICFLSGFLGICSVISQDLSEGWMDLMTTTTSTTDEDATWSR